MREKLERIGSMADGTMRPHEWGQWYRVEDVDPIIAALPELVEALRVIASGKWNQDPLDIAADALRKVGE